MKIEKVSVSESGYGTCLLWEKNGFRYHTWHHTPAIVFKNPPYGVEPRQPGFFSARKLDAASKENAAMVAEAQRIATELGLYEKAIEAKRLEEEEEKAKHEAAIVLNNKRRAAEEMYEALRNIVFNSTIQQDMRMEGTTDIFAVPLDDIEAARAALAKADGKEL